MPWNGTELVCVCVRERERERDPALHSFLTPFLFSLLHLLNLHPNRWSRFVEPKRFKLSSFMDRNLERKYLGCLASTQRTRVYMAYALAFILTLIVPLLWAIYKGITGQDGDPEFLGTTAALTGLGYSLTAAAPLIIGCFVCIYMYEAKAYESKNHVYHVTQLALSLSTLLGETRPHDWTSHWDCYTSTDSTLLRFAPPLQFKPCRR